MLIPAVHPGAVTVRSVPLLLIPSLSDCLFLTILLWVFAAGSGWSVLLADGDTGWHIRAGEYILDARCRCAICFLSARPLSLLARLCLYSGQLLGDRRLALRVPAPVRISRRRGREADPGTRAVRVCLRYVELYQADPSLVMLAGESALANPHRSTGKPDCCQARHPPSSEMACR